MDPSHRAERTIAALVIGAAALLFLVMVALGGPFYQSFDEAKYVGLGRNLMAGAGYTTVFGSAFTTHPPAWPIVIAAPEAWFGIDALTVGRVIGALSGAGLIVMAGVLAWRVAPAAGALAAIAMLAVTYLGDLSRTARLDVPGAAVTVLAVLVGTWAMRRDSTPLAILSGAVFALAFLVKETSLVFVVVPTLGAIAASRPTAARIAHLTAALGLTLGAGCAWWFVVVAGESGVVYRTSLPGWMLVPLGAILLGLAVIGWFAPAIGRRRRARRGDPAGRPIDAADPPPPVRRRPSPTVVAFVATVVWATALLVVLARSPELGGAGILDRTEIRAWLVTWQRVIAWPVVFATSGVLLAVLAHLVRAPRDPLRAAHELLPAVVVGLPFILFVIATGEPPRNDFAPLAFSLALAAGGWVSAVGWLRDRPADRATAVATIALGAVVGVIAALAIGQVVNLPRGAILGAILGAALGAIAVASRSTVARRIGGRGLRAALTAALVVLLVVAVGMAAAHVVRTPGSSETAASRAAVETIAAWVEANVPTDRTLAVGSLLGNEVAIELPGRRVVKLGARQAQASAAAPLGLTVRPGDRIEDWLSVDPHPRKTGSYLAFDAATLIRAIRTEGVAYWVYVTGRPTAAPTIVPALTPAHGFEPVAHWSFGDPAAPLEATVFRIDPGRLGFADAPILMAPAALDRLVRALATAPSGPAVAAALAPRVVLDPDDAEGDRARQALERLASGR